MATRQPRVDGRIGDLGGPGVGMSGCLVNHINHDHDDHALWKISTAGRKINKWYQEIFDSVVPACRLRQCWVFLINPSLVWLNPAALPEDRSLFTARPFPSLKAAVFLFYARLTNSLLALNICPNWTISWLLWAFENRGNIVATFSTIHLQTFHCFSLEEGNHRFTAKSTDGFSKAPTSSFLGLQLTLLALVPNPQVTINYRFLQNDDASD